MICRQKRQLNIFVLKVYFEQNKIWFCLSTWSNIIFKCEGCECLDSNWISRIENLTREMWAYWTLSTWNAQSDVNCIGKDFLIDSPICWLGILWDFCNYIDKDFLIESPVYSSGIFGDFSISNCKNFLIEFSIQSWGILCDFCNCIRKNFTLA